MLWIGNLTNTRIFNNSSQEEMCYRFKIDFISFLLCLGYSPLDKEVQFKTLKNIRKQRIYQLAFHL